MAFGVRRHLDVLRNRLQVDAANAEVKSQARQFLAWGGNLGAARGFMRDTGVSPFDLSPAGRSYQQTKAQAPTPRPPNAIGKMHSAAVDEARTLARKAARDQQEIAALSL